MTIFWIFGYKYLILNIGLIILVTIARTLTNAHNLLQIIAGILIGIISTFTYYYTLFIQL
jgi:membrane-associated phospholipid phosphatase